MVAKDNFPFASTVQSLDSWTHTLKSLDSMKYTVQLMVGKDTSPFETVTDGCKKANFMGFY